MFLPCESSTDFSFVNKLLTMVAVGGVAIEFFGDEVAFGDNDSLNGD